MESPSQNISFFANAFADEPEEAMPLSDFLHGIKSGVWAKQIAPLRQLITDNKRPDYDMRKRNLPAVTLSIHCLSRKKELTFERKAITHTGWLQADFDLKDNPILATQGSKKRSALLNDPHVHAVFVGPSGEGVKAVVAIPADYDGHKNAWIAAEAHFRDVHGLALDKATKDPMRLCFVSHDPELATSADFVPLNVPEEQPALVQASKSTELKSKKSDLPPPTPEEIARMLSHIPPRPDYDTWLKIASAVWSELSFADGVQLLNEWSPEEKEGEYHQKHRARLKQVGIGSLVHIAKEHGYQPPASKAVKVKIIPDPSSMPKIYYAGKGGYAIEHHGKYIPLTSAEAVNQHLKPYLGKNGDYDAALCHIRLNNFVCYIGPVAGHRPGIHTSPDMESPFLVTTGPKLINGMAGDFPFIDGFLTELFSEPEQITNALGWLRQALKNVVLGKRRPLPALALVGPRGCGKSLFIELTRLILGGRSANALKALNGSANFNIDTLGAELLAVDDDIASKNYQARVNLAQGIKRQLFAGSVRVEGKFRDVLNMRPIQAVILAVNSEPENMMVLPAIDDSLADKISLYHCSRANLGGLQDREEIIERLNEELPAFVHFLERTSHPVNMSDRRTGIAAWHHPIVLEKLRDMQIEECFRDLVSQCKEVTSAIDTKGYWEGSALELQQLLLDDNRTRHGARNILTYPSACGEYLGRLRKAGGKITSKIVRGYKQWKIESLSKGGGVDPH